MCTEPALFGQSSSTKIGQKKRKNIIHLSKSFYHTISLYFSKPQFNLAKKGILHNWFLRKSLRYAAHSAGAIKFVIGGVLV
jgi:hypothetical protein